jgi:hypothetical protein
MTGNLPRCLPRGTVPTNGMETKSSALLKRNAILYARILKDADISP